jgi:ribosomal protein S18 acetylase RimI-like enzyme
MMDHTNIEIRRLNTSDLRALVGLNDEVQSLHAALYPRDFKRIVDAEELHRFMASIMDREENKVALACVAGVDAGYIWFEIQNRPETPFTFAKRRVFLHHICVASDHRRRGVASALMRYMDACSKENDAVEMVLETWSLNEDAHAFFRSCGFERHRIVMRK